MPVIHDANVTILATEIPTVIAMVWSTAKKIDLPQEWFLKFLFPNVSNTKMKVMKSQVTISVVMIFNIPPKDKV